jgi:hypothetical protein
MAKSFKDFLAVPVSVPVKPTSERDFFDLTEEVVPRAEPVPAQLTPTGLLPVSNPPSGIAARPQRKPERAPAAPLVSPPLTPEPLIPKPTDLPEYSSGESVTSTMELTGNTDNKATNGNRHPTRTNPHPGNTATSGSTGKPEMARSADLTSLGSTPDTTGNTSVPDNPIPGLVLQPRLAGDALEAAEGDTRQTFVLSRAHLERLRDYVHARRSTGDYLYSQKQALQEALDLLLGGCKPVPRPQEVREWERQRRASRQRGHRS